MSAATLPALAVLRKRLSPSSPDRADAPAAIVGLLALYLLMQGLASQTTGVFLAPRGLALDLGLHVLLALLLAGLTRNLFSLLLLLTLLMAIGHVGNALKIAILGAPIGPNDLAALPALLGIAQGVWLVLALALLFALAFALVYSLRIRGRHGLASLGFVGLGTALVGWAPDVTVAQLDRHVGHSVWNQPGNYQARGPLLHSLQETARYLAHTETPPPRAAVARARQRLSPAAALQQTVASPEAAPGPARARNVHMIVLESFWDPSSLTAAGLSADPLGGGLRERWNAAGNPRALSPVFGGYTANAEFEALCGFPVTRDEVIFEARLRNSVPCLPAVLRQHGYHTLASHPNVPAFWNRTHAYRQIGFDRFLSQRAFEMDDMNDDYLGDASLYRQVLDRIDPLLADGTPLFNYVLTFFGHLDYPLNAARPETITLADDEPMLRRYANTVHYKSQELMAFLAALRERDPDGLIVVFGDHLPFLGPNFEAYTRSGVLAANREDFTDEMFLTLVATPLLVSDGPGEDLPVGPLPLFQLPALIAGLLALPEVDAPFLLTRTPPGLSIRPLPGLQIVQHDQGLETCRADPLRDSEICKGVRDWLSTVELLGSDLFSGQQHLLAPADPLRTPDGATEI